MILRRLSTPIAALILLLLPLIIFAPVVLGARTILPVDALFQDEPYRAAAEDLEVGLPQNGLLVDLILENYAWKQFALDALQNRELPLWDPYIFSGHPFLANGQHSLLYPLSLVFYLIPLWRAYGVFAWLQLGLAGWWAYLFARTLGVRRLGALVAGITFQLSGFMLVSVVHPMIIAGASWLPFILAMVELVIQQRPALGSQQATLPWALLGGLGLGCQMLAGHAENTYFVLLVTAIYVAYRLGHVLLGSVKQDDGEGWRDGLRGLLRPILWLTVMLLLGLALGAVQFIPLYEVATSSFRSGEAAASLDQVLGWAYKPRRIITFGIPNFFGNPAHQSYYDLFLRRTVSVTTNAYGDSILSHDWGIKNYVEGGAYLGLLPLVLALIAILQRPRGKRPELILGGVTQGLIRWFRHPHIPFFTILSLFSLGCIFGTPLYALVYALPYISQSHSPFRWVFPLTLSVAVLAGFGVEVISKGKLKRISEERGSEEALDRRARPKPRGVLRQIGRLFLLNTSPGLVSLLAVFAFWIGILTLVGLLLSLVFFSRIEPVVERVFWSLAKAPNAFLDHRAFYSYEFPWIALFGLLCTGTGIVLRVSRCAIFVRRRPVWEILCIVLLAVDLISFGWGFHVAVDPELLDYTPPVADFLLQDASLYRYATFTPPGTTKTMNANVGMFYDLQTVAGYDSLFSRQYADYMSLIEEQDELQYNRIASFSDWSSLDSPLTDLLNVKYIVTEEEIPNPAKWELVYQDETVRVYQNLAAMPRAFTLPYSAAVVTDDAADGLRSYDPHQFVILEEPFDGAPATPQPADYQEQTVTDYTINEVYIDVNVSESSWLVMTDSFFPGWKAFARRQDAEEEMEVELHRVDGNFRGVLLEEGAWTVRFKYSPNSVKVGAFTTFIAGMVGLFLLGLYLWRYFYREEDEASTVRRVAKNSLAPIILNLFNKAIDFAFAALMARMLGPVGNGRYTTAANIYLLFDTFANFGLDMYLMREVARDRDNARRVFVNATALRLFLFAGAIPVLAGFIGGWQALGASLARETVWALILLYIGLLPQSVAYGLAALFRGFEKHEIPAAIQTVTTVVRVTLGVLLLVGGLGVVGVAGASIVTNVVTLVVLAVLAQRAIWAGLESKRAAVEWGLQRKMLFESWPLMLSLLLQSLFPSVNVLMLQRLQGDAVVGWYDAARKWVDALNIVPQFFTYAVFPVMSRLAAQDRTEMRRWYQLSVKMLAVVALPVAVIITLLSTALVGMLSGVEFLPYGAVVLRILIWSIVFGWINSLTNFALIALDRQRYVFAASGVRVVFTAISSLVFVRTFSYVASAWIMVAGELLLMVLFHIDLRRQLEKVFLVQVLGRPILAAMAMGGVAWVGAQTSQLLAIGVSLLAYLIALVVFKVLTPEEINMLAPLIPWKVREEAALPSD
jgi:O-antigen/teichoic acid export membrane protein